MKIALVGSGYWGSKLLRNLVAVVGGDGVVVVDVDVDRLAQACSAYPAIGAYHHLDEVLADPDIGAVVIATPVATHEALATAVLESGRHALVEKPLSTSVDSARRLVELAEARGLVLMVGHTFLFSPRVQWLADFLNARDGDDLHYVTSSRLNLGIHRSDVNVIWDLAPHDFSVMFYLLGEMPLTAQTSARSIVQPDHPDVAFVDLAFPSGVIASIAVSWFAPRKIRNLMVVGDSFMLVYDDTDSEEPVKVHDRGVVLEDPADFGMHQLTYRYGDTIAPHIAVREPLAEQITQFIDAIEHNTEPLSDGRFGLDVVAALEAADASWRNGGVPVAVAQQHGELAGTS